MTRYIGPSLREFIRRLGEEIREVENTKDPLIFLEFKGTARGIERFQSRIAIYDISTRNEVLYRYADKLEATMRHWPVRTDEYQIIRLVPPSRSTVFARMTPLGIIQVGKP